MTTETPARPVRLRFRQSFATVTAVFVTAVGAFAVAGQSWWYAPLMVIPLAALWWVVRSRVDVDAAGLRVRGAFGTRTVRWDDVEGFSVSKGRVAAHLTEAAGSAVIRLPAVTPTTLPHLVEVVNPAPATTAAVIAPPADPATSEKTDDAEDPAATREA